MSVDLEPQAAGADASAAMADVQIGQQKGSTPVNLIPGGGSTPKPLLAVSAATAVVNQPIVPTARAAAATVAFVRFPGALIPVSAEAASGQATVTVVTQISVQPIQASSGSVVLVTVATQISVQPVQASSGAGAFATATTQVSVQPIQAATGSIILLTVATQISVIPVQAASGSGVLVTVLTMIAVFPVRADSDAGSAVNNVTAPALLTSV